jgi:predicted  nucleic acid-binding Zn-ribbon protein
MSNHLGDTNKMVSDTPRMKAAVMAAMEHGTGNVYRVGCDIERELNAAHVEIEEKRKDIVYLATEKAKLEDRIKRLEEAGIELRECASWVGHSCCQYVDQIRRAKAAIETWDKEAKL